MTNKSKHPEYASAPIAVVGMSCIFPKAQDLKSYWRLIRWSEDAIREVPESHWPADDYFDSNPKSPDRVYCRRGAFLEPVDFDPTEFGIPPTALEATDTAQLLGLLAAKSAIDDAGYGAKKEFDRSRTSVILGVTGTLELVIPLGARLGHPHWLRALRQAGVDEAKAAEVMRRISEKLCTLAGKLLSRTAGKRRCWSNRQPPRPQRHQLCSRRRMRQLAKCSSSCDARTFRRSQRYGRDRRCRYSQ